MEEAEIWNVQFAACIPPWVRSFLILCKTRQYISPTSPLLAFRQWHANEGRMFGKKSKLALRKYPSLTNHMHSKSALIFYLILLSHIKIVILIQENIYPYIVPSVLGIIHVALTGSVYTTIAVAVERCVTVCAPFTSIKVLDLNDDDGCPGNG